MCVLCGLGWAGPGRVGPVATGRGGGEGVTKSLLPGSRTRQAAANSRGAITDRPTGGAGRAPPTARHFTQTHTQNTKHKTQNTKHKTHELPIIKHVKQNRVQSDQRTPGLPILAAARTLSRKPRARLRTRLSPLAPHQALQIVRGATTHMPPPRHPSPADGQWGGLRIICFSLPTAPRLDKKFKRAGETVGRFQRSVLALKRLMTQTLFKLGSQCWIYNSSPNLYPLHQERMGRRYIYWHGV
jgi:hypothetical protein